ncbi:MAG: ring-cleaving dioxygenase [Solibacillus sp.]
MHTISGHHHISMITKNATKNNHFYKKVLGLRRVKLTVNQDSPSMYHLFFGDKTGSPGTELSFFEIPMVGRKQRGTNAITRIGLVVPTIESLEFWRQRFISFGVEHGEVTTYANRPALHFQDAEGLQLVIQVTGEKVAHWETWDKSDVPAAHQIQGMGTVEVTVANLASFASTVTELFGYHPLSQTDTEAIFQSVAGEIFGEFVAIKKDGPNEKPGKGSIHHVAIRIKDDEELIYWEQQVRARGFMTAGIVDRYYFKSLYFREENGILFELATDGPGFMIDGDVERLGEQLDLPPFLQSRRAEIEADLKPIEE